MLLLLVPGALGAMVALLVLASWLEQRRVKACVRMAIRSSASPEATEALVIDELGRLLATEGLISRPRSAPT